MDAAAVRPSARQLSWQRQELTAFVHFGPSTIPDLEWGTGLGAYGRDVVTMGAGLFHRRSAGSSMRSTTTTGTT
jgi:hypothetical protein